jgi:hypothetical protein
MIAKIASILRKNPALRKYIKPLTQIEEKARTKAMQINTQFNKLEDITIKRIEAANINKFITEQKALLKDLKKLIASKKNELQKTLSPKQKMFFDLFNSQLERHLKTIDSADAPEILQPLFSECAQHLNDFIAATEPVKGMRTSLPSLREISASFKESAEENLPYSPLPHILSTKAPPEVPSEASKQQERLQQQQQKEELQAFRATEDVNADEGDLYVISGNEDEDIDELIQKVEKIFVKSIKENVSALPEKKQHLFVNIEKTIAHLRVTLDEKQGVYPSDVEALQTQVKLLLSNKTTTDAGKILHQALSAIKDDLDALSDLTSQDPTEDETSSPGLF